MKAVRTWLRTNAFGFPLIVLMSALILVTVTWPSKSENLGYRTPSVVVPAGGSTEVEGATWTLKPIQPDLTRYRSMAALDERPPNSRVLTFLVTVTGGTTTTDRSPECAPVATDGTRRWSPATLSDVRSWVVAQPYSSFCRVDESFVLAFLVPNDADVDAVDFLLTPPPEGDAAAGRSRGRVVRFDTG